MNQKCDGRYRWGHIRPQNITYPCLAKALKLVDWPGGLGVSGKRRKEWHDHDAHQCDNRGLGCHQRSRDLLPRCGIRGRSVSDYVTRLAEVLFKLASPAPSLASLGLRAVALDMRGYGQSTVCDQHKYDAQERIAADMLGSPPRLAANARSGWDMIGAAPSPGISPATIPNFAPPSLIFACHIYRRS
jgi:hypothetical protein